MSNIYVSRRANTCLPGHNWRRFLDFPIPCTIPLICRQWVFCVKACPLVAVVSAFSAPVDNVLRYIAFTTTEFFWGSNLKYKFLSLRVVDKIVCCFTGFTAVILIPRRKLGKKGGTRSWTFLLIHCFHWKNGTLVYWNKKSVIFIIQFASSQKNKGHRSELFFHCLVWIRFLTCKQTNLKRKEKKCDSEELKLLEQSGKEEQKKKKTIKNFSLGGVESRLLSWQFPRRKHHL